MQGTTVSDRDAGSRCRCCRSPKPPLRSLPASASLARRFCASPKTEKESHVIVFTRSSAPSRALVRWTWWRAAGFVTAGDIGVVAAHPRSCDHIRWWSRHPKERRPKMTLKIPLAALTVAVVLAPATHAAPTPENSDQNPVVRPVFNQTTNVPGKSLEAVTVSYPPGAKSGAHHHAKSAFIMAYVISGAIRSQVEGEPERVYHAGETWSEAPGAHHTISENASATEPAELMAVFLLSTGDGPLTTDDTARN